MVRMCIVHYKMWHCCRRNQQVLLLDSSKTYVNIWGISTDWVFRCKWHVPAAGHGVEDNNVRFFLMYIFSGWLMRIPNKPSMADKKARTERSLHYLRSNDKFNRRLAGWDRGTDFNGKCIEFCQNTKKVGINYTFKISNILILSNPRPLAWQR
jgi:hypothetical protein